MLSIETEEFTKALTNKTKMKTKMKNKMKNEIEIILGSEDESVDFNDKIAFVSIDGCCKIITDENGISDVRVTAHAYSDDYEVTWIDYDGMKMDKAFSELEDMKFS